MADVSRRSFFKLLGGAVALAATPLKTIENVIEIPVEFGWTWKVKDNPHSEFSKIITKTLRENRAKIAENVSQNNALYLKLKEGQKIKLNIERISPELQTERMAERLKGRKKTPNEHIAIRNNRPSQDLAWSAADPQELHKLVQSKTTYRL